ncbi:MAG: hypothetical protein EBS30_03125 [Planctomycetes bacterium]|nr:hypothetical protein [Planctomycetota bacterium]
MVEATLNQDRENRLAACSQPDRYLLCENYYPDAPSCAHTMIVRNGRAKIQETSLMKRIIATKIREPAKPGP